MPVEVEITLEPLAGLTREHRVIAQVVDEAQEAIDAARRAPTDPALVAEALERLRDLGAFMENDLALHIAKEELIVFPALRLSQPMIVTVEEMVEQHDEVRARREALILALDDLDGEHDEVSEQRTKLSADLEAAGHSPSPGQLTELWETVRRLHWILQGHFGDEEDDLFLPAESMLSSAELADLAERVAALDAEHRAS